MSIDPNVIEVSENCNQEKLWYIIVAVIVFMGIYYWYLAIRKPKNEQQL